MAVSRLSSVGALHFQWKPCLPTKPLKQNQQAVYNFLTYSVIWNSPSKILHCNYRKYFIVNFSNIQQTGTHFWKINYFQICCEFKCINETILLHKKIKCKHSQSNKTIARQSQAIFWITQILNSSFYINHDSFVVSVNIKTFHSVFSESKI